MKYLKIAISLLLVLLVNSTCRDEFALRDFPSVITTGIILKGNEGIEFSGEIIARNTVDRYEVGFIWNKGEDPIVNPGFKIRLSNSVRIGKFNVLIATSLKKNTEYFVRAYARSGDRVIYGEIYKFRSPEDFEPRISSVSPLIGLVGDTITISGGIFNSDLSKITVKFNDLQSEIVFSTDSIIRCIVPMDLISKESTISLIDEGPISVFPETFFLSTPSIVVITPELVNFQDTISISGTGFHKNSNLNKVKFGDADALVLTSSPSLITARAPYITDSLIFVSVTVSGQTAISSKKIKVISPDFDFFEPESGNYLDTIMIHCKNIKTGDIKSVLFNNVTARIIFSGPYSISVEVPTSIVTEFSDIKINLGTVEYIFPYKFRLNQPSLKSLSAEKIYNQQILTIKGSGFNPVNSGNHVDLIDSFNKNFSFIPIFSCSDSLQIKILNPNSPGARLPSGQYTLSVRTCEVSFSWKNTVTVADMWRKLANFPGGDRYKAGAFTVNGKGYAGLGTKFGNDIQKDIWEFNPVTELWTRKTDFPGNARILPCIFMNNSFGFIGGGQSNDNFSQQTPFKDFFRFNPATNTWSGISDAPLVQKSFPGAFASTSSNNHIANLSIGLILKYTEASNSWSMVYTGDAAVYSAPSFFSINNKVYFAGGVDSQTSNVTSGKVWELDTETNIMTRKNDYPGKSIWGGFGFSIGNTGYIGCGQNVISGGITQYLTDVYKYDPVSDTWIQLESFPGGYKICTSTFVIGDKAYIIFGSNGSSLSSEVWEFYPGL
jgi:N-acetylneuraminic acid mutarotase